MVYQKVTLNYLKNILTWDRAVLLPILIADYDVDFMRLIWLMIYIKAFGQTTTLSFLCLVQQLCDMAIVPHTPEVDHRIKMMCKTDITLIKDLANLVLAQKVPQPYTAILVYFERLSILFDPIARWDVTMDVKIGEERAEPNTSTTSQEATTISIPALTSTSEPIGLSTVPLLHITTSLIGVP